VVVTVDPQHISTSTSGAVMLAQKPKVKLAFSANESTQYRQCWRSGHTNQRCPTTHLTCPICALHDTRAADRCQNPTWPRGGNNQPVRSCCPTCPPHCCNCGNHHTATFTECPLRPVPDIPTGPTTLVQSCQDPMDMAVDGGPAPSTPPAMEGCTEMDLVTPRQPAPAGPTRSATIQGSGGPLRLEAQSPSPAPASLQVHPGNA